MAAMDCEASVARTDLRLHYSRVSHLSSRRGNHSLSATAEGPGC